MSTTTNSVPASGPDARFVARTRTALDAARAHLLGRQAPEGYWRGLLETNVTMDAEDLLLRAFLGVHDEEEFEAAARWIRHHQRDDGTWANYFGGPGDLSTTVEAYSALRLVGDSPDAPHLVAARRFILENGGVEATRVFSRIWLALVGLHGWDELPILPPEMLFLPPKVPLNIYDFGCWARQTIVAMTIVTTERPVRPIGFDITELYSGVTPPIERSTLRTSRGRFVLADRAVKHLERLAQWAPIRRTLREAALRKAETWIIRRQEADGSWGGIQPPWVYSMIALSTRGYRNDHPVMARAFSGIESFLVRDGEFRWLEACQSPIWDTALSLIALADAGVAPDDPALVAAADWLVGEEVRAAGDWAIRNPHLTPGGWAFEFANDNYPDVDDTTEVVIALRRVAGSDQAATDAAIGRAITWVEGMASRDGAWGAFDADNVREVLYDLPFCDFGAVIDPPSADVTAHAVEMLAGESSAARAGLERAISWLRAEQEPDGSWYGRWGVNYIYGTQASLMGLAAAGVARDDPAMRRAVAFLESHQNPDGGFGEDIRSYDDPALRASGTSTASQTAWALVALVTAGDAGGQAAHRAAEWLIASQRADGTWDEPYYTGTGFPGFFYINYHLYRLIFPVSALGRYLSALGADVAVTAEQGAQIAVSPSSSDNGAPHATTDKNGAATARHEEINA